MRRGTPSIPILASGLLLAACGGGQQQAGAPVATPPPPPPAQLALDAANYQLAVANALDTANLAFGFAKMGTQLANAALNNSLASPRLVGCREAGTVSIELTDRNRNGMLNANDTVHLFMEGCTSNTIPLTGVVHVEVVAATPIANGRELDLSVQFINVVMASTVPDVAPVTINFIGSVQFTTTTDLDHYVVTFGDFQQQQSGQTKSMTNLVIDYLQRYDTQRYDYLAQGTVTSGAAGQYRLTTPAPFTGAIGAYPDAGRLALSGAANSTARLAEEGAAAANGATVLVSVDANGDGTADAAVPDFAWDRVLQSSAFSSLRDYAGVTLLPLP